MRLSEEIRDQVRHRAHKFCEYCRLPERASILPHQVDHIIAQQHGGSDDEGNLCLCCIRCNLKKGPNIASIDPQDSEKLVALFNPRLQDWQIHFQLTGKGRINGLTPEGRTTVHLLDFNAEDRVQLRLILMRQGWQPS